VQSIAFRVVSIYWQGVAPFPWYLNAKGPTPIRSTCIAHTSPHSVAAVRDIEKSLITANVQLKTGFASSHQLKSYVAPKSRLKLAARCPVSGCWLSCSLLCVDVCIFQCSMYSITLILFCSTCIVSGQSALVHFWATVCKTVRPMLSDRCLSVLSVTFVYCGQTVEWIKMKLCMQVGLGPGHIVLDRDPAPPPPKGHSPTIFSLCLLWTNGCMDQDVTW